MKNLLKNTKFIKALSITLAGILLIGSVAYVWRKETMEVKAAGDTLPGIAQLRDSIIKSDEPYKILELVPAQENASLGFYFGGSEPLGILYDQATQQYVSWEEKLATYGTKEERRQFMAELEAQAEAALSEIPGVGAAPYEFENYRELDAPNDETKTISYGSVRKRGYLQAAPASEADWWAVFEYMEFSGVDLDTINNGTDTPYYKDKVSTKADVQALAENDATANTPMYKLTYGDIVDKQYYEYCGTAAEVWETIKDVSPVDASPVDASPVNPTVSSNDYYSVEFELINGNPDNAVAAGDYVYLVKGLEEGLTRYVEVGGNYKLTESVVGEKAGENFDVPAQQIYYMGGLKSNEVFRNKVLSLNAEEEYSSLKVELYVMTPQMLNDAQAANANFIPELDMVYIAGGGQNTYGMDINDACLTALTERITGDKGKIPCMVDLGEFYYIADGGVYRSRETANVTNLYKLLAKLMGQNDVIADGVFEGVDIDRNMNFVYANTWFFDDMTKPFVRNGLLSDNLYNAEGAGEGVIPNDLLPVYDEIALENQYRAVDSAFTGEPLSTEVYDWTIWRYVVNYANRRANVQKSTLHVLEIQPASRNNNQDNTTDRMLNKSEVSTWTGIAEGNIFIETMAMNEFIGVIDDLNATYDLIYIGADTAGLNVDGNGNANYNDNNMDGLLYSHVGDTITDYSNISGLLNTDYTGDNPNSDYVRATTTHRFTGNDLTVEKYNVLLEYLKATYPIVIDEKLLEANGDGWQPNAYYVDNSSYLYEFLNKAFGAAQGSEKQKSIFCRTDLAKSADSTEDEAFEFYANRPKLSLVATEDYPNLIMTNEFYSYTWGDDENPTVNGRVTQIDKVGDKYYLQFRFKIENSGAVAYDENYTCKLYLDSNADGKFSEVNEELTGLSVTADGKNVPANQLQRGVEYTVTREVPENYYGCITWQLDVSQSSNQFIRTTHKGYTKLKTGNDIGTVIKILQVYANTPNQVINLQESIGTWNPTGGADGKGAYEQIDVDGGGTRSSWYFSEAANAILSDYVLDITTINRTQFQNAELGTDPATGVNYTLNDYDMLILGFSDANAGEDFTNAIGGDHSIQAFIQSGKSVLFAHDMTSFINVDTSEGIKEVEGTDRGFNGYADGSNPDGIWGFQMNKYIRPLVGLDSYGVTYGNLQGDSAYEKLKLGKGFERINGQLTVYESVNGAMEFTTLPEPKLNDDGTYAYDTYDVAYLPRSGRNFTVPQVQGFTSYILHQRANSGNLLPYRAGMDVVNGKITYKSREVEKVNDGQITNFPFVIADKIPIAETHAQYYTLELNGDSDKDKQTDVVVWYNMSDQQFSYTAQDVRNNYYIYNKGNVTYTGMGHSGKEGSTRNHVTLEEAQLFINTMVAAYNVGIRAPKVMTYDENGVETDTLYNYYDAMFAEDAEETVNLSFGVEDLNMGHGSKQIEIACYVQDDANGQDNLTNEAGGEVIDDTIKLRNVTEEIKDSVYIDEGKGDNDTRVTDITTLQPGVKYYIKVKTSYFKTSNNGHDTKFYIYAKTTMTETTSGSSVTTETPWGNVSVRYVNVDLFDLD